MLKKFSVSNFKTLYDKFELNMEKVNAITGLENKLMNVTVNKKEYSFLPSKMILGGNAVGKSNVIMALDVLKNIIMHSQLDEKNSMLGYYHAYSSLLDSKKYEEPIKFYIDFIYKDNEYEYYLNIKNNFKDHSTKITYEKFIFNNDEILERINNEVSIVKKDKIYNKFYEKYDESFIKNIETTINDNIATNDKIIFTSYFQIMPNVVNDFKDWFNKNLVISTDKNIIQSLPKVDFKESNHVRAGIENKLIKSSDFGNQELFYDLTKNNDNSINTMLVARYSVKDDKNNAQDLTIDARITESTGTLNLINLFNIIRQAIHDGSTLLLDEFDASINYTLIVDLLNLFYDPDINKNHAQIIFTTHNPIYLSNDFMRRDEIMFIEKDEFTLESKGYLLSDLSIRKDENLLKNYISGKYVHINPIDFSSLM